MAWIPFDPTKPPPKGDYWCEVPALQLRDGGCLCRALYWTGERWEGPGGEYEVGMFVPEMLPQLHGRGDDASERTSSSAIDDTIEHLLGDISALSESIAEDEARAKARKLRLKVCRVRANALHHMAKDWRDVAQKMTDDGDDWKLASALARISDLEAEVSKSAKLFELVSAERNMLVRNVNEAKRERDSMALRIERMSAELAKPEDKRLREVTEAMSGRAVMFDDIAERVRQELHELGMWIERAGKAERERNEALARATEAERHKGRRDDQIRVLVMRVTDAQKERDAASAFANGLDSKLTAIRNALTKAGVPDVEPYNPDETISEHERSLRTGGRSLSEVERVEKLAAMVIAKTPTEPVPNSGGMAHYSNERPRVPGNEKVIMVSTMKELPK